MLTIRGDNYQLRAKRKSGFIKPPAADGPPVGSASLRPVSGGADLHDARGQFRMAFDTGSWAEGRRGVLRRRVRRQHAVEVTR